MKRLAVYRYDAQLRRLDRREHVHEQGEHDWCWSWRHDPGCLWSSRRRSRTQAWQRATMAGECPQCDPEMYE